MKKFFVRLLCCFIPSRKMRHKIWENAFKTEKILEKLVNQVQCLQKQEININDNNIAITQQMLIGIKMQISYLEKLLKTTVNVQDVRPATGNFALVQSAAVAILSQFAKVANKHHLDFWLDSGSLIGFIRHNGGFVPWDDDIDIAMPRKDYERLPELLDKEFCKGGFFYRTGEITRLYYKTLHVWVDVFPFDKGYSEQVPTGSEYDNFVKTLNDIKSETDFDCQKWLKHETPVSKRYLDKCFLRRNKELVKKVVDKGFMFYGVETGVRDRTLYENDIIYPLQPVEFFGIKTFIPHKYDEYLFKMYGNYMTWPKNFDSVHGISLAENMDALSYDLCHELINKFYPDKETKHDS